MSVSRERPSARREELLDRAYAYVLAHGLSGLSLRPLAAAIGSSPRVLLFLFGSKEELVRALLARARDDELALLDQGQVDSGERAPTADHADAGSQADTDRLAETVRTTWQWLCAPSHRPLLALWAEAYARSLTEPEGPWRGFARQTVEDWLGFLTPVTAQGTPAERTLALAVLRGLLLDVLATGDVERTSAALERYLTRR